MTAMGENSIDCLCSSSSSVFPKDAFIESPPTKPKRKKTTTKKRELQGLLVDATKYYPTYENSMPTSYLKSSSRARVSYNERELFKREFSNVSEDEIPKNKRKKKNCDKANGAKKKEKINSGTKQKNKIQSDKTEDVSIIDKKKTTKKKTKTKTKTTNLKTEYRKISKKVDLESNHVLQHNDRSMKNNKNKEGSKKVEKSTANFVNWNSRMKKLNYQLFDIDWLKANSVFQGTPTSSLCLQSNASFAHNNLKREKSERIIPIVKLQSVLFSNYQEEYQVDFESVSLTYNPMTEIGILIEYTAMVYLPEKYRKTLLSNIIPNLNNAFDNSNADKFIKTVEEYNSFIRTIPRTAIINHLSSLNEIPTEFIHNFLHIIYTRSIHPNARKLRHYKAFSNFVYGELLPNFLSNVYGQCKLDSGDVFMDLGSGVGNCVIQAGLEYGCKLSLGCEIMPAASDLTEVQTKELNERCKLMGIKVPDIEFSLRESFVDNPRINELISKCDVLLVNNFLFDSDLNKEVEKILQHAKVGCKIISLKNVRSFGYTINFYDIGNVLNRLNIEKFQFGENSVSWTHTGGEYYISTVLSGIDESLFSSETRFRRQKRNIKYTR